eukprot:9353376-Pyramimonas_sp.AAC.1
MASSSPRFTGLAALQLAPRCGFFFFFFMVSGGARGDGGRMLFPGPPNRRHHHAFAAAGAALKYPLDCFTSRPGSCWM